MVVLRFPASLVPTPVDRAVPEGVSVTTLDALEPEVLRARFESLTQQYGPVGAFVHVHPRSSVASGDDGGRTRSMIKAVFLAASHLGPALTEASADGRSLFATVTRMDGTLGLGSEPDFDPIAGGFSGLVKTLHLEWSGVFCRAIDLDPAYDGNRAVKTVVAELQDPNRRLVDVGWQDGRRVTLDALEEG